ncbi:hypothetical protein ABZ671_25370 [Micromonospora sp. NPDC006766]|uniref:hypothetical protein n=1 Tax=Micromonospora sp. NPDC006766 TaxID=3154778 RepID=UPI0033C7BF7F
MSIGEVKATLEEANRLLDQGKTTLNEIGTALDETAGLVLASLHDSRRAEADKARKAIAEAVREVQLTLRVISAAQDSGTEFRKALG